MTSFVGHCIYCTRELANARHLDYIDIVLELVATRITLLKVRFLAVLSAVRVTVHTVEVVVVSNEQIAVQ